MGTNKKSQLIKSLLSGKLTKDKRQRFLKLESVEKEIEKQWDKSGKNMVNPMLKEQIWRKIKLRSTEKPENKVNIGLWSFLAASVAILLVVGGLWFNSYNPPSELIKVIAKENRIHILPDSSKVWMQAGSSIQYSKAFHKERKVWLSGNSLFEVYRHKGSTFQVYINKAFIEVKGTCFLIKQNNATENEIMLFHGKIEFCVESSGLRTAMKPLQKMRYNPNTAQTELEEIVNINWENGKYKFTDIPLAELIQAINQMHNADITLGKEVNQESAFTGSIRYDESLDDIISKICFSLNLRKEEKNNKTIIRK